MKKNVFAVGIVSTALIIVSFVTSCASSPPDLGVYDASVSEDQLVILEIAGGLKVVGFNGNEVSWAENDTPGAWRAQAGGDKFKTIIRIPPGNHTLQATVYLWPYNMYPGDREGLFPGFFQSYFYAEGLVASLNFLPGHTYFLRPVFTQKFLFGKEQEVLQNDITADFTSFTSVRLRIEEDGTPVVNGNIVTR